MENYKKYSQKSIITFILGIFSFFVVILNDIKIMQASSVIRETDNSFFLESILILFMIVNITLSCLDVKFSKLEWVFIILASIMSIGLLPYESQSRFYMFMHFGSTCILILFQFLILIKEKRYKKEFPES